MTEAASIQDSPTELNYAVTTKPSNEDTQSMPVQQYSYARTGPVKVRFLNQGFLKLLLSGKSVCTCMCVCVCVCVCPRSQAMKNHSREGHGHSNKVRYEFLLIKSN